MTCKCTVAGSIIGSLTDILAGVRPFRAESARITMSIEYNFKIEVSIVNVDRAVDIQITLTEPPPVFLIFFTKSRRASLWKLLRLYDNFA